MGRFCIYESAYGPCKQPYGAKILKMALWADARLTQK